MHTEKHPGQTLNQDKPAQQQFKEECDINRIVASYAITGQLPMENGKPIYADFSGITDFSEAQTKIAEANQAFMLLDPKIRKRFQNDPAQLLAFLSSSENLEEAQKLGIIAKTPVAPVPAPEPIKPSPAPVA